MTKAFDSRNIVRRHPVMTLFLTFSFWFIGYSWWAGNHQPERKKLDYSRAVVTSEGAIICPQKLLYDVRLDHDATAVFEAFTAFTGRAEKVEALGCTVVRGGIAVTAHRMSPPNDDYVAVNMPLIPGLFFTMEANLENSDLSGISASTGSSKPGAGTEAVRQSYEAMKIDFERQLPGLERPTPDLRWFKVPAQAGGSASDDSLLVLPPGPCALMSRSTNGYIVLSIGHGPKVKPEENKIVGLYQTPEPAKFAAEQYCERKYASEITHLENAKDEEPGWFKPDNLDLLGSQPTNVERELPSTENPQSAPIERKAPIPDPIPQS